MKQKTAMQQLIEELEATKESIFYVGNRALLPAIECAIDAAKAHLPAERQNMEQLLAWYNQLPVSQKVSVWSKDGRQRGVFELDAEQLVEKYFTQTFEQ